MAISRAVLGVLVILLVSASGCTEVSEISFLTADGGIVYADEYGTGDKGLVLAHGGRFTKESWAHQAPVFADAGFRVVAIDFRGRGDSQGPDSDPDGVDVHFDVIGAVKYLKDSGASTVSVVGASFGGWAAANAAVEIPGEIERLVILAAGVDTPEKLTGRTLFILARDDFMGEGTLRLPAIQEDFDRAPDPKELILLDGEAHAQYIFETDQADRLMEYLIEFLTRN